MALIALPAMAVTINFKDSTGSEGSSRLHVAATAALDDINTWIGALGTALAAFLDTAIVGYAVSRSYIDNAAPAPVAGSRVERRAAFGIRTEAGKVARATFPGVKAALVNPAGGILSANAAVLAVTAELVGGNWTDSNGSPLEAVVYDEETYTGTTVRQKTTDTSAVA
jgi:hypothetical protein